VLRAPAATVPSLTTLCPQMKYVTPAATRAPLSSSHTGHRAVRASGGFEGWFGFGNHFDVHERVDRGADRASSLGRSDPRMHRARVDLEIGRVAPGRLPSAPAKHSSSTGDAQGGHQASTREPVILRAGPGLLGESRGATAFRQPPGPLPANRPLIPNVPPNGPAPEFPSHRPRPQPRSARLAAASTRPPTWIGNPSSPPPISQTPRRRSRARELGAGARGGSAEPIPCVRLCQC
jgi:hypothetical protein